MANIYCVKCGKTGFSKCPVCRSIFGDEDTPLGMIDASMSHRLAISDEGILLKRYKVTKHPGPETDHEILKSVVGILKRLTDEELKVISCAHEWDFVPFERSSIGCGHGSEEKPLSDYMTDAWQYLTGHEGATSDDLEAAQIVHDALSAIVAGIEWIYQKEVE